MRAGAQAARHRAIQRCKSGAASNARGDRRETGAAACTFNRWLFSDVSCHGSLKSRTGEYFGGSVKTEDHDRASLGTAVLGAELAAEPRRARESRRPDCGVRSATAGSWRSWSPYRHACECSRRSAAADGNRRRWIRYAHVSASALCRASDAVVHGRQLVGGECLCSPPSPAGEFPIQAVTDF